MRRDYYAVLGIAATAGPREVRQAYRRLARLYSPDVNFWDASAPSLFDEITEAYRVLTDPAARALYDQLGMVPGGEPALGAGRRGDDVHVTVELSFAQAARGLSAGLRVARFSPCRVCQATGMAGGRACGPCGSRGVRRVTEPIQVEIPPGVDAGMQLRVPGEGSAAPFGGPRGDLVVSTRVQEHPFFVRKGDSVHCEVPVSVWEALRGARIRVPTPAGDAVLVVPPGTPGGQMFRLRGHGLPRLAGDTPGDLYVTVRIALPTGLDARTDELVRELERLLPLEPRAGLERHNGGAG
jgi:DnaJ-class molecular chaperone